MMGTLHQSTKLIVNCLNPFFHKRNCEIIETRCFAIKVSSKVQVVPPLDKEHQDDLYNEANDNAACKKNH